MQDKSNTTGPHHELSNLSEDQSSLELASVDKSRKQILRSTSIMGGASAIGILLSLLRAKVVALAIGPSGIGLLGLMSNLMNAVAIIAALGIGTSGVRFISEAVGRSDTQAVARARRTLLIATSLLAILGAILLWVFRRLVAAQVLGDPDQSHLVGWASLGVALLVASGAQGALLNGMRRIGDLARMQILSALTSTIVGVSAVLIWGEKALMALVLAAPLAMFLVGHWYVRRLALSKITLSPTEFGKHFLRLARLGMPVMFAGLVLTGGLLLIRTRLQTELGSGALGLFEAAWMISTTYLGAVMGAMGTDYYPRLTALTGQPEAAVALVNEQTRIALWLCGPVCVSFIGLAPWIFSLMFSSEFAGSVEVLRWQLLGDLLKILGWPLGFLLLALGEGRRFLAAEILAIGTFTTVVWFGLPYVGLAITGIGFLLMYVVYVPVVYLWAKRRIGFHWDFGVRRDVLILGAMAITTAIAAGQSPLLGAFTGIFAGAGLAGATVLRLRGLGGRGGPVGTLARALSRRSGKVS